jgi:hypothetical protein
LIDIGDGPGATARLGKLFVCPELPLCIARFISFTMAALSPRLTSLVRIGVLLVLSIAAVRYLTGGKTDYKEHLRRFRDEKKLFVADYLEHEIDGAFDGSALRKLCTSKKWTKGLILSCDPAYGGVGEVKNAHLHCIRFAIEMGGQSRRHRSLGDHEHQG